MSEQQEPPGLKRAPTGVPGLDIVLNGGFIEGGVYIVQGDPGSGKTILANQICFRHIAAGGRVLYVTLLAEAHARLLQQLRTLSFFDEAAIPDSIFYVSAFNALEDEGLPGLLHLLRREVRGRQATMLVLDGFLAAEASAPSEREFKKFIHDLQSLVAAVDCTAFFLTNDDGRRSRPERTMVDGILLMDRRSAGQRTERSLEVVKLRSSDYLQGRHSYRITSDGHRVFPRFEAMYAAPTRPDEVSEDRAPTGVPSLDKVIGGGFPARSTSAVVGPSGVGKTTLGLYFISQSTADEPGLFFGFFETPPRLLLKAKRLGLDLESLCASGVTEVLWAPPTETLFDEAGHQLLDAVRRRGVRRLVIDGLGGFIGAATDPTRIARFFAALANELRVLGVTTLYTMETRDLFGAHVQVPIDNISSLVENLLFMRFVERRSRMARVMAVVKMRDSDFDPALRHVEIDSRGMHIGEPFHGAEAVMTGFAHERADQERPNPGTTASTPGT
jgi:circadian clock protein KaiC